jgi:hypothetical protein
MPAEEEAEFAFDLLSEWRLRAPIERIWGLLRDVEAWPSWWPCLASVEPVRRGDANGVGAIHRLSWTTSLPYRIVLETRVTAIEPLERIAAHASGELVGCGIWTLDRAGEDLVIVRYRWRVTLTKRWMRWLAPLLHGVFAWNHDQVMERGRKGIEARLAS